MGKNSPRKTRRTEHTQVPFVTRDGEDAEVDKGLLEILTLLKDLGVETQYSCQGSWFPAYICADTKSFKPVIRQARQLYRQKKLSPASMVLVRKFSRGELELDFWWPFENHRGDVRRKFVFRESKKRQHYAYERQFSKDYGSRITVRWPKSHTILIRDLLLELAEGTRP